MRALALIPVIWVVVFLVWLAVIGTPTADGQEVLPESSPVTTACAQAAALAEASQVAMTNCRLVGVSYQPDVNPNRQLVTVRVKINGQGWFQVKVFLTRAVWNAQTQTITAEVK